MSGAITGSHFISWGGTADDRPQPQRNGSRGGGQEPYRHTHHSCTHTHTHTQLHTHTHTLACVPRAQTPFLHEYSTAAVLWLRDLKLFHVNNAVCCCVELWE